jgi:hypothetical protein
MTQCFLLYGRRIIVLNSQSQVCGLVTSQKRVDILFDTLMVVASGARSTRAFHFQSTTSTRYRPPRRFLPSVLFRVNGVSGKVFFSLSRGLLSYSHQEPRIFISMHITKISSFILDLEVSLFQRLQV